MTGLAATLTALAAAGAVALSGADSGHRGVPGKALVIDAEIARDGRELVAPHLLDVDAEVRLPRDLREARTNVRYFDELGYRVVVVGPRSRAAADAVGVR